METVASLLSEHVSLRLRSVDRIGVAGYVPNLMHEGGLVAFLLHRASLVGTRNIPSPALLGHNHDRLVKDLDRFVTEHDLSLIHISPLPASSRRDQVERSGSRAGKAVPRAGTLVS